jgi:hypothetical protein
MTSPTGGGGGAHGQTPDQLSGVAGGSAVQARSIAGGVHFHAGPRVAPWA